MKNAVEWILSSLEEALEDIGDEESDIPILPLADFSVKAMDNDMFQRLLQAIGIKQPVNFQVHRTLDPLYYLAIGAETQ